MFTGLNRSGSLQQQFLVSTQHLPHRSLLSDLLRKAGPLLKVSSPAVSQLQFQMLLEGEIAVPLSPGNPHLHHLFPPLDILPSQTKRMSSQTEC